MVRVDQSTASLRVLQGSSVPTMHANNQGVRWVIRGGQVGVSQEARSFQHVTRLHTRGFDG